MLVCRCDIRNIRKNKFVPVLENIEYREKNGTEKENSRAGQPSTGSEKV
jgi:hypothetical protein